MANMGDIYYTFRGDGARLQADAKVEGQKAGGVLGKSFTASLKKSFTGANLGKGLVQGLGLAGALGAFGLASKAASAFTDAIGDGIRAAVEDEASQQKLGTALRANVASWDGNTEAIERTLEARMALGFSDDEQRDSLARIVVATHDVTKALEVQRTAMDLARLKGISLAEASDALIKVEAGQFRALKALGIQLAKGATAQDALTAVQKVATGQAEDYADTTAGKMLVAQTKLNEALEKLGYVLLPAVAAAADALATAIDGITATFEVFSGGAKDSNQALLDQQQTMIDMLRAIPGFAQLNNTFLDQQQALHDAAQAALENKAAMDKMSAAFVDADDPITTATTHTDDFRRASEKASRAVVRSWDTIVEELVGKVAVLQAQFFDPIAAKEAQLEANRKLRAGLEAERTAKTSTEHHDAAFAIKDAINDEITALEDLQKAGNLTGKDVTKVQNDAKAGFAALGLKVPADLQKVIDAWGKIAKLPDINLNISAPGLHGIVQDYQSLSGGHDTKKTPVHAAGGYQRSGQPYRQDERGFEATVPWNAYIMGHNRTVELMRDALSGSSGGSSGGDTNVSIQVAATNAARKPSDIVREVRIAARDGTLRVARGG